MRGNAHRHGYANNISFEHRSVLVSPVSILLAEVARENPSQLNTSPLANSVTGEGVVA